MEVLRSRLYLESSLLAGTARECEAGAVSCWSVFPLNLWLWQRRTNGDTLRKSFQTAARAMLGTKVPRIAASVGLPSSAHNDARPGEGERRCVRRSGCALVLERLLRLARELCLTAYPRPDVGE